MVFNKNIPQPTDLLDDSQQDLLNNNIALNDSMGVNHYPFDNATVNNGKHKFIQLPEINAANPDNPTRPATAANEGALYTKESGTITRLFWRPENTAVGGVEYALTNINPFLSSPNGYTFLPNGLLLIFGVHTPGGVPSSSYAITFPNSLTLNAPAYSVTITTNNTTAISITNITNTGFEGNKATTATTLYWMAIGSR
jgi:hypothetical protein